MSIKILVADDESIIRKGLKKIITRIDQSLFQVDLVRDGREALDKLKKEEYDIILTDIKMPKLSGVDLIKEISSVSPRTRIIVISGYDDFEYVKKSMKYGARDYLLKPVKKEAISAILTNIKIEIEIEIEKKQKVKKELVSEVFLNYIKNKRIEHIAQINLFDTSLNELYFYLATFKVSVYDSNKKKELVDLFEVVTEKILADTDNYFYYNNQEKVILLGAFRENNFVKLSANIQKIINTIRNKYGYRIIAGLSSSTNNQGLNNILALYRQSSIALNHRIYKPGVDILYFDEIQLYNKDFDFNRLNLDKVLINYIDTGDQSKALEGADEIINLLVQSYLEPDKILTILDNILLNIKIVIPAIEQCIDMNISFKGKSDDYDSFETIRGDFIDLIKKLIDRLKNYRVDKERLSVTRAKYFIKEHFNEEITLEDISGYVYMNPTYFSEFFKRATGEKYIDYLTRIRLNNAKKLLSEPGAKVYEVGLKVGYNDPTYFSKVFKKKVGISPSQYRGQHS